LQRSLFPTMLRDLCITMQNPRYGHYRAGSLPGAYRGYPVFSIIFGIPVFTVLTTKAVMQRSFHLRRFAPPPPAEDIKTLGLQSRAGARRCDIKAPCAAIFDGGTNVIIRLMIKCTCIMPARHTPGKHPAGIQESIKLVPGLRALQGIRREDK